MDSTKKGNGRASLTAMILFCATLAAGSGVATAGQYDNLTNTQTAPGWKQVCRDVDLSPTRTGDLVNPLTRRQCLYFARAAKFQSELAASKRNQASSNQLASKGGK